jgi:hypothetical protein
MSREIFIDRKPADYALGTEAETFERLAPK